MSEYISNNLPLENVYGHRKKVTLIREALDELRAIKKRGLKILDIGCGNGSAVTRFLPTSNDKVLGLDFHAPSIEYANSEFSNENLEFQVKDAEALAIDNKKFDAIILADILEHVYDPDKILHLVNELLEDDGRVLVTIPNGYGPFEIETYISKIPFLGKFLITATDLSVAVLNKYILKNKWTKVVQVNTAAPYNIENGHVQFYTQKVILKLFSNSNFKVRQKYNLSFVGGPFTNYLWAPFETFCNVNAKIANVLPARLTTAWLFVLHKYK